MNPTSEAEGGRVDALLQNEEVLFRAQCFVEMIRDNPNSAEVRKWALLARAEIAAVRRILQTTERTPPPADRLGDGVREATLSDAIEMYHDLSAFPGPNDLLALMQKFGLVIRTAQRALPGEGEGKG